MDLLSHDILNLNQTVLSYIELLVSSSDLDKRAHEHAQKATSQMRISTQIVESINAICLLQKERDMATTTTNLTDEVDGAAESLSSMLPYRGVRCTVHSEGEALVRDARNLVSQSILNALMNMTQLDPSETPEIDIRLERAGTDDEGAWIVRIHDANMTLPPGIDLETVVKGPDESRSKTVRLAGVLLSKMMAEKLGGTFEIDCHGERGGAFNITFEGAQTR